MIKIEDIKQWVFLHEQDKINDFRGVETTALEEHAEEIAALAISLDAERRQMRAGIASALSDIIEESGAHGIEGGIYRRLYSLLQPASTQDDEKED